MRKGRTRLLHHHSGLSRSHDSNLCAHKASVCSWRQCNQPLPLYSAHFNTSTTWAAFHVSRERHLVTWGIMVISEKSSYLDPLVMNSSTTTGGRWCTPASNAESFMSSSPSYSVAASPGGSWGAQGELGSLSLIANALSWAVIGHRIFTGNPYACAPFRVIKSRSNSSVWAFISVGNDITSQLERRDWMKKNLTGSNIKVEHLLQFPILESFFQDTTSSPASLWGTSFSSGNSGSTRSSLFGGSSGQSSGVGGGPGSMWTPGSSNSGGQSSSAWSSRGIGAEQSSSNWSSSSRGYRTDRLMQMDWLRFQSLAWAVIETVRRVKILPKVPPYRSSILSMQNITTHLVQNQIFLRVKHVDWWINTSYKEDQQV